MSAAKAGQRAHELICPCCHNVALVIGYAVRRYRCRFCDTPAIPTGRGATLGPQGALADGWWEPDGDATVAAIVRLTAAFPGTVVLLRDEAGDAVDEEEP
jgi:hypothetical protein